MSLEYTIFSEQYWVQMAYDYCVQMGEDDCSMYDMLSLVYENQSVIENEKISHNRNEDLGQTNIFVADLENILEYLP